MFRPSQRAQSSNHNHEHEEVQEQFKSNLKHFCRHLQRPSVLSIGLTVRKPWKFRAVILIEEPRQGPGVGVPSGEGGHGWLLGPSYKPFSMPATEGIGTEEKVAQSYVCVLFEPWRPSNGLYYGELWRPSGGGGLSLSPSSSLSRPCPLIQHEVQAVSLERSARIA